MEKYCKGNSETQDKGSQRAGTSESSGQRRWGFLGERKQSEQPGGCPAYDAGEGGCTAGGDGADGQGRKAEGAEPFLIRGPEKIAMQLPPGPCR